MSGLDGYTVDVATLNVLTLRASIGLTFPKISLNSLYNLDALLLRFIPIFGHGRLALDVNGKKLLSIMYNRSLLGNFFLCKTDLTVQANGRLTLSIRTGRLNLTALDIDVNMGAPFVREILKKK